MFIRLTNKEKVLSFSFQKSRVGPRLKGRQAKKASAKQSDRLADHRNRYGVFGSLAGWRRRWLASLWRSFVSVATASLHGTLKRKEYESQNRKYQKIQSSNHLQQQQSSSKQIASRHIFRRIDTSFGSQKFFKIQFEQFVAQAPFIFHGVMMF